MEGMQLLLPITWCQASEEEDHKLSSPSLLRLTCREQISEMQLSAYICSVCGSEIWPYVSGFDDEDLLIPIGRKDILVSETRMYKTPSKYIVIIVCCNDDCLGISITTFFKPLVYVIYSLRD